MQKRCNEFDVTFRMRLLKSEVILTVKGTSMSDWSFNEKKSHVKFECDGCVFYTCSVLQIFRMPPFPYFF